MRRRRRKRRRGRRRRMRIRRRFRFTVVSMCRTVTVRNILFISIPRTSCVWSTDTVVLCNGTTVEELQEPYECVE